MDLLGATKESSWINRRRKAKYLRGGTCNRLPTPTLCIYSIKWTRVLTQLFAFTPFTHHHHDYHHYSPSSTDRILRGLNLPPLSWCWYFAQQSSFDFKGLPSFYRDLTACPSLTSTYSRLATSQPHLDPWRKAHWRIWWTSPIAWTRLSFLEPAHLLLSYFRLDIECVQG